jgi:DNA repair protein RadC
VRSGGQPAAALIFAHNHPSGNPEPSAADHAITIRLREALALIDVRRSIA